MSGMASTKPNRWWEGMQLQPGMKLNEECMVNSRKTHKLSNALVNARLVVLFTDKALYGRALAQFYPVFSTLEEVLVSSASNPDVQKVLPALVDSGLLRAEGIEKDLQFYLGPKWRDNVPSSGAVLAYVQHLKQLAREQPVLLLAHTYTQHTAMASGGQILKRWARKKLQLPEDQGTGIFDMADPPGMKARLIAAYNDVGTTLSTDMRKQMIAEHLVAFEFNNAIMREFRVGWLNVLRGLVRMAPPLTRISLLMLLMALLVLWWSKLRQQQQG